MDVSDSKLVAGFLTDRLIFRINTHCLARVLIAPPIIRKRMSGLNSRPGIPEAEYSLIKGTFNRISSLYKINGLLKNLHVDISTRNRCIIIYK